MIVQFDRNGPYANQEFPISTFSSELQLCNSCFSSLYESRAIIMCTYAFPRESLALSLFPSFLPPSSPTPAIKAGLPRPSPPPPSLLRTVVCVCVCVVIGFFLLLLCARKATKTHATDRSEYGTVINQLFALAIKEPIQTNYRQRPMYYVNPKKAGNGFFKNQNVADAIVSNSLPSIQEFR